MLLQYQCQDVEVVENLTFLDFFEPFVHMLLGFISLNR